MSDVKWGDAIFGLMAKRVISDHEVARYRELMRAVEASSDSVRAAAERLGIKGDQFSNFRERRMPGLDQLWLALQNLNLPLDFFSTSKPISPRYLTKRVFPAEGERGTASSGARMGTRELSEMLRRNPAVDEYLKSADGEDTPLGVRVALASIDWETMGIAGGAPAHDQIHEIRVVLQKTVKDSL